MLRNQVFPYYRKYVEDLAKAYEIIKEQKCTGTVEDLCALRGYLEGSEQYNLMKKMGIQAYSILDTSVLGDRRKELALVSEDDNYLLEDRFVIPVPSASGDLLTLIGYYPDYSKYITLPTRCFSKNILFFNIDHALKVSWQTYGGIVFLVEGIFDALSLRSLGLPAIATMGNNVGLVKAELLKVFRKVVYIPDNDATGRKELDRNDKKHGWRVPFNATGVKLKGCYDNDGITIPIKDIDKAVSLYDAESLVDLLLGFAESKEEYEELIF